MLKAKLKVGEEKKKEGTSLGTCLHVLNGKELCSYCVKKLANILVFFPKSFIAMLHDPQTIEDLIKEILLIEAEIQKKRN